MPDNSAAIKPTISLVIPAWNEAEYLPRLLDSVDVARQRFRGGADAVEVIVADNGSTDATASIARSHGYRVAPVEKRCIAAARNGGAAAATGEIVAFSDADFRISPESFNFIDSVMSTPGYIGGATGLTMERWSVGIAVTWNAIMPPLWLIGLDGGIWFCRRSDFVALGGYNDTVRAGEDVRFLLSLRQLGKTREPRERLATRFSARRLGIPTAVALNSTRKFDKRGDWHMLWDLVSNIPPWIRYGKQHADKYIDNYWYQGR